MFSFKRIIGNQAEQIALAHLQQHNLELIERNYLTKLGEIDIIMLDKSNHALVFVEVRYRKNSRFSDAIETVTTPKQRRIIQTAQHYLQTHSAHQQLACRFDVVGVESDLKYPTITWIKDAFEA